MPLSCIVGNVGSRVAVLLQSHLCFFESISSGSAVQNHQITPSTLETEV